MTTLIEWVKLFIVPSIAIVLPYLTLKLFMFVSALAIYIIFGHLIALFEDITIFTLAVNYWGRFLFPGDNPKPTSTIWRLVHAVETGLAFYLFYASGDGFVGRLLRAGVITSFSVLSELTLNPFDCYVSLVSFVNTEFPQLLQNIPPLLHSGVSDSPSSMTSPPSTADA